MPKFEKGHKLATGRPKGVENKTTQALKEAILRAAEVAGYDGNGKDGLIGYCTMVAKTDVKSFCTLLGKVLPLQLKGDDDGSVNVTVIRFSEEKTTVENEKSNPS